MYTEFEATFTNVRKEDIRAKLTRAGAKLIKKEFLQKRTVFNLPKGHEINGGWLRVRDEGDKITMSLKVVDGDKIENQKESCLKIDNFETAAAFLENIGWLRVRDEGDKITMSLKVVDGDKIENQKESCLKIDNFETAAAFLENIG